MQWTRFVPRAAVGLLGLVALACRDSSAPGETRSASPVATPVAAASAAVEQVDILKAVMAPFREFHNAAPLGYSAQITDCMSDPVLGGMGFHYGNPAYIDGIVELERPELVVYAPQPGGWKKLVAVEYIVPYTAWTSSAPPRLFARNFARNDAFQIWALHVWLWQFNPSGLFADWNPTVKCLTVQKSGLGPHTIGPH